MDKLLIRQLEIYAAIGVTAAEQEVGQWLLINLEAGYDLAAAGQSDQLADTISYASLAETVREVVQDTRCQLLEFLAEQISGTLLSRFPLTEVKVQLFKKPPPLPLKIAAAGVEIHRRR